MRKMKKVIISAMLCMAAFACNVSNVFAYEVTEWSTYYSDDNINQTGCGCNIKRRDCLHGTELTLNTSPESVWAELRGVNCTMDIKVAVMEKENDKKYFYIKTCASSTREYYIINTYSSISKEKYTTMGRVWY